VPDAAAVLRYRTTYWDGGCFALTEGDRVAARLPIRYFP